MSLLYITADRINSWTGGGKVTFHESEALKTLGEVKVFSLDDFDYNPTNPWMFDDLAMGRRSLVFGGDVFRAKLAHFYAGTWPLTVLNLQKAGCKVTITCAAHDREESQKEHELLGFAFDYPHLTDPDLWDRYSSCYRDCDVLICPSTRAAEICRRYGRIGRIEVIPHGCDIPEEVKPLPESFTVGYMGNCAAPDKGLIYLLQTWETLGWKDSVLVLAGHDSTSPYVSQLVERTVKHGTVVQTGFVDDPSDFYNSISCYVQPSVTEGFGLEVLEAMAHGRPVICSTGAGAADVVPIFWRFEPRDVSKLVELLKLMRDSLKGVHDIDSDACKEASREYTWDKIRQKYIDLWRDLLS